MPEFSSVVLPFLCLIHSSSRDGALAVLDAECCSAMKSPLSREFMGFQG